MDLQATKGLAAEYGPDQIRVNVPMGRLTNPMDVANAALFLASDDSKFVTGVNMEVDGGRGI